MSYEETKIYNGRTRLKPLAGTYTLKTESSRIELNMDLKGKKNLPNVLKNEVKIIENCEKPDYSFTQREANVESNNILFRYNSTK
jgi:hypothetical protein